MKRLPMMSRSSFPMSFVLYTGMYRYRIRYLIKPTRMVRRYIFFKGNWLGPIPCPAPSRVQTGRMQNPSEFWSAMGGKPKPQCNYQVTFAMDVFAPVQSELINRVNMNLREDRLS